MDNSFQLNCKYQILFIIYYFIFQDYDTTIKVELFYVRLVTLQQYFHQYLLILGHVNPINLVLYLYVLLSSLMYFILFNHIT